MKVKFEAKFAKDLRTIREPKMLSKVQEIIGECKSASSLSELNHVKKMQGYERFYRIGLEFVNDELIFTRFLHRKEVYKYFP